MTEQQNQAGIQPDSRRWGVLFLLFISLAVNLLDRQVLAVLAPVIREELHLTASQYSYIVTAFLIGLTLAQVPSGMLLDRIGTRIGLPILMLWWSAANAAHAAARTLAHLIGCRFLLGVGECGNYSAGVKVISQWFPQKERALAGGIFNGGSVIGAFVAPYLIVKIMQAYGWRAAFLLPSLIGLIWIVPWLMGYRDRTTGSSGIAGQPQPHVPLGPLLRMREVWGVVCIRAFAGPVQHFYWYWLPEYLKHDRNFTLEMIGRYAGIPFLFAGLGNLAGGWFSGRLIGKGVSVDTARKLSFTLCGLMAALSMLVPVAPDEVTALILICMATFALGAGTANHIGLLTDMFSPQVMGRITGLSGMMEGCVNIVLTLATGALVDRYGYLPVFIVAGCMPVFAFSSIRTLVRRVRPL
ncbi:MAG: MFS transporter [Acidobacteria bacterium]|nr:MFS transporter [Acidobacteriota bacterium]